MVHSPSSIAVTLPLASTVAIVGSLLSHVRVVLSASLGSMVARKVYVSPTIMSNV